MLQYVQHYTDKLDVPLILMYTIRMKKIENVFIKAGFRHELVKRKENIAIYKRTQLGTSHPHYEVVRINKHNGYYLGGSYIEPAETYPGNSLWGLQGWTCQTIEAAEISFNKLLKKSVGKKQSIA